MVLKLGEQYFLVVIAVEEIIVRSCEIVNATLCFSLGKLDLLGSWPHHEVNFDACTEISAHILADSARVALINLSNFLSCCY